MTFKNILNKFKSGLFVSLPMPLVNKTTIGIGMTPTSTKLNELRKLMSERNLAAYYVPSEDAHQVNI